MKHIASPISTWVAHGEGFDNENPKIYEGEQTMSKEKQIEEMASFVCSSFHGHHDCENCSLYEERCCVSFGAAKRLYNAGYRRQSEGEGEWIDADPDGYMYRFTCTLCGKTKLGKGTPFCPYCGAKMKGGAE